MQGQGNGARAIGGSDCQGIITDGRQHVSAFEVADVRRAICGDQGIDGERARVAHTKHGQHEHGARGSKWGERGEGHEPHGLILSCLRIRRFGPAVGVFFF